MCKKCVRFIFSSHWSGPGRRAGSDREWGAARDGGCGTGGRSTVQQYSSTATERETAAGCGVCSAGCGRGMRAGLAGLLGLTLPALTTVLPHTGPHHSTGLYCTCLASVQYGVLLRREGDSVHPLLLRPRLQDLLH